MRTLIGILGIIVGVVLGVYVGGWICFIGGIIGLIHAAVVLIHGGAIMAGLIGWSILKIFFAGLAGYVVAVAIILPSLVLLHD